MKVYMRDSFVVEHCSLSVWHAGSPCFDRPVNFMDTNGRNCECRTWIWRWNEDVGFIARLLLTRFLRFLALYAATDWQRTVKFPATSLGYHKAQERNTVWRCGSWFVSEESIGPADSLSGGRVPCWQGSAKPCKLLRNMSGLAAVCSVAPNLYLL
jgi:hypothetical protein